MTTKADRKSDGKTADASWQGCVNALGEGGYRRYDERTSTMLGKGAELLLVRGLWQEFAPYIDRKAVDGARRLGLPTSPEKLSGLVPGREMPRPADGLVHRPSTSRWPMRCSPLPRRPEDPSARKPTIHGTAVMCLRLLILDHLRIRLFLWYPVLALASASRFGSEGSVPRDPPPTEDLPEGVKEPSPEAEEAHERERDAAETEGEVQEPPD